jgi:hypothetical protein
MKPKFKSGPAAVQARPYFAPAQQEIGTLADLLRLAQQRPVWGQDYLGAGSIADGDQEAYFDQTPHEQGRQIPQRLGAELGDDSDMENLAGMDPYGKKLPPTWALRNLMVPR